MPQHIKDQNKLELIFPQPGQPWGGLNRYDLLSRYTIGDADSDDLINWIPMGASMRQVPAPSTPIATLVSQAVWISAQVLNLAIYIFVLCKNGNLYQVSIPAGVITQIGASFTQTGTIASGSPIVTALTSTAFMYPGMSVTGANIPGGTTILNILSSTSITLTANATANATETLTFGAASFSSATDLTDWQGTQIIFTDPQTANGSIYAWDGTHLTNVFQNQPANFIAVYQGRLFGAFNSTVWFTDANTYNSLGGSAGSFKITDSACALPILAIISFAGSLMIFGGNWIQILSNMYVYGSPPVANFTLYQLETQIGTISKWSIIPLGSALYFANSYGVWVLNGSVPQMVSTPIDAFFNSLDPTSSFSAGYTQVYGIPCLLWNVKWIDPGGTSRHTTFGLTNSGQWFRNNFGIVTFVTSTISATNPTLWGTDGFNIFSLFTNLTTPVTSTYQSKYWNLGQPIWYKLLQKFGFVTAIIAPATASLTIYSENGNPLGPVVTQIFATYIQWINNMGQIIQWNNNSSQIIQWTGAGGTVYNVWQFNAEGRARAFGVKFQVIGQQTFFQAVTVQTEWSQAVWGS